jgi:hypothetical protein
MFARARVTWSPFARSRALIVGALVAGSATAIAQPGQPPPAPGPTTDPAQAVPAPVPAPAPPGPTQKDYDAAFDVLVSGDLATGAARLDDIAAHAQDPALAARAGELARFAHALIEHRVVFSKQGDATGATPETEADDRVEGRTSFIVWTTLYSLYGGIVIVDDADINDTRGAVLTVTATTAAGFLGSYFATKDRTMTGSMADAYSLGMIEGVVNAALLVEPLGVTKSGSGSVQTSVLASGAVGAVAGLGYGYSMKPTRGQVAFAGTMSALGTATAGLGIGAANPHYDSDHWLVAIAAGTDLGLVGGFGIGRNLDWSVSRGRIVQLGVLLGGLAGLATGALIIGNDSGSSNGQIVCATTLGGVWAGFAATIKLTSGMRPDRQYATAPTTQLLPMPTRGGGGLALTGAF